MSAKCHLCLLGLIFLSSLLTGSSGVNETHVFISSGGNVHLPCNNALHDCKSTTWNYDRVRDSGTVELIAGGIKKKDMKSHKRLSLGSDCSLNIKNVKKEDYGSYSCRQYVNYNQEGTDARVFLHVLHVSSSQAEISAGRSVTIFCQLYSYAGAFCDYLFSSEGIELFWVNQAGVKLKISDSRYQISAPGHCIINLTTTLLNEDHNREWRCNVTHRDQVKTSATYTVKISDDASELSSSAASYSRTLIPVSSSNSQMTSRQTPTAAPKDMITNPAETEVRRTAGSLFRVIVIILEFAAFAAPTVILLQIICARRSENKEKTLPTMKKRYDGVLVPH